MPKYLLQEVGVGLSVLFTFDGIYQAVEAELQIPKVCKHF